MQRAPTPAASPQAGGAAGVEGEVAASASRLWFKAPAGRPSEALRLYHAQFELRMLGGARRESLELSLCRSSGSRSTSGQRSGSTVEAQLVAQLNLEFDGLPDGEQDAEPL